MARPNQKAKATLRDALEALLRRLRYNPFHAIYETDPDYVNGLNVKGISDLARECGVGPIITSELQEDEGRVISVHHPDGCSPVEWHKIDPAAPHAHGLVYADLPHVGPTKGAKHTDTLDYLQAWIDRLRPRARAAKKRRRRSAGGRPPAPLTAAQYVTLDQAAALVNRSKKTLERHINKRGSDAPAPDVEGGGGRPHEWKWPVLRPWLEKTFGRILPEQLPSRPESG